ncbi:PLANT INVERTASE/PECTIN METHYLESTERASE INHIBITOR SUPERFAMILY PROTEIN [Salix purpurea]|uniref:PLANT INVERTASE/PECTIN METHYLESTERASE INHIBITOR SUPERFAMILY PROTEIN n=1 Tax=Salix purpurea TaxID=77065 RepID=A0A9Q0UA60_SALPP|nr:PLANT INVERTASE/PECTIN METHYLESTERASE INHIBITOR SUPERFAMILY PROTEIN [Salix purpurea]
MPAATPGPLLLFTFSLTTFLLYSYSQPILTVASPAPAISQSSGTDYIRSSCGATLYPKICYTSLSRYASAVQQSPGRLARVAINVSLSKALRMTAYLSNLTRQADFGGDHRAEAALQDCFSNMGDAVDEMRGSLKQLWQVGAAGLSTDSFQFQMSNVQTWMSAALTDEETCTDGFEDVADGAVKTEVCSRAADAKKFTSNALALVNAYAAAGTP